ncbi:MAG: hypothetical protein BMS9Abin28_1218 [Anaerolineae bacterium]|nr:MAG: hypothetical protein BMS9Abin28_1218 [Anaerolineae bacterium]
MREGSHLVLDYLARKRYPLLQYKGSYRGSSTRASIGIIMNGAHTVCIAVDRIGETRHAPDNNR